MKVAAYQAPLLPHGSIETALGLIRRQIDHCEAEGVEILCCPEGILGGLADYASPGEIAINAESGQLDPILAALANDIVTTIVGFTEITRDGRLFNTAAVLHKGSITGLYRKLHPAVNRSVYDAGDKTPVFKIGGLTFGIIICNDSNFSEPARIMASNGATALFVPTNNGLPHAKAHVNIASDAMKCDIARAVENRVYVIRADVAGRTENLVSYGSSEIVDPNGAVIKSAQQLTSCILIAEIDTTQRNHHKLEMNS